MSELLLPEAAYATALAGLAAVGPARLAALLGRGSRLPSAAWRLAGGGGGDGASPALLDDPEIVRACGGPAEAAGVAAVWSRAVRDTDVGSEWAAACAAGIGVTYLGAPDYPAVLAEDVEAPGAVFWVGDLAALEARRVTVVGTRACTPMGAQIASELGSDLTAAGVAVVSGLAIGIDGAAHRGAIEGVRRGGGRGPAGCRVAGAAAEVAGSEMAGSEMAGLEVAVAAPIGVVASGLDKPYPRRHARLWAEVAQLGLLLSETAPGRALDRWRFPARNRILAGLAEVVVVVESHAGGGSMLTVEEALKRGIDVMAVPGSVRSPASSGPNALLADGAAPVRNAADVLDRLGLRHRQLTPAAVVRRRLPAAERRVLDAVDWAPTSTGNIVAASGLGALDVARCLHQLQELGLVRKGSGWWERQAPPRQPTDRRGV